jgi:nitrogen fixation protein NifB
VWHLRLSAAPRPLILRRDRVADAEVPACSVADVLRYVAVARRNLKGPLALEIEGPGDPLASPETVLRALSLVHDHHPDVVTGLVIDGPLMAEYVDELVNFGLGFLVIRVDAACPRTAHRLVAGALYRGQVLSRAEAAEMVVEETAKAIRLASRRGIPVAVRTTLVPTINRDEVGEVARRARAAGAARLDVVPHAPALGTALARAGVPTAHEMARAREEVAGAFNGSGHKGNGAATLSWLSPERLEPVDVDVLDATDIMRVLPDPADFPAPAPVLPPRRTQLIAVATRDGTLVDTPLASAHLLRIYAVTGESIRCLGIRALAIDPRRRHDGVGHARDFLEALMGCKALVATHLTARAITLLRAVGILPVARGGRVEDVLDRVARGTVRHAEAGH